MPSRSVIHFLSLDSTRKVLLLINLPKQGVMAETGMLANSVAVGEAARAAGATVIHAPISFKDDSSDNPNPKTLSSVIKLSSSE